MKTTILLRNYLFGLVLAVLGAFLFAPAAEASYYHQSYSSPSYYSYSQPSYGYRYYYTYHQPTTYYRTYRNSYSSYWDDDYYWYYDNDHYYDDDYYWYYDDDNYYWDDDDDYYWHYDNDDDPDVETLSARDIEDDEATLHGEVDFGDDDRVEVWFQYGEDTDLDERSSKKRLDEDDDDERFKITIDDLDEDEKYYYRAVVEGEDGDREYGKIKSFRTDDDGGSSSKDDEPTAETGDADDITDDSAEIEGEVDMNDFNNGVVFFVWGEDEDEVEDVEDEDRYSDIDEDGDDLQKERVDNDLDGDDDYTLEIENLDDNTDIYYRICVEYEDDDDDDTLECGDVEEFETD